MAAYPLGSLGLQIKAHWKAHRPRMYAELERAGTLAQALYEAATLTSASIAVSFMTATLRWIKYGAAERALVLDRVECHDSMSITGRLVSRRISPVGGPRTCPSPDRLGQHLVRARLRPGQILHGRRGTRRKRPTL